MKSSGLLLLVSVLTSPMLSDAQEIQRAAGSLEQQQAISRIGQAEYYTRMALKSLEAAEKIGKAPYFNYQNARDDIENILAEFKTYLKGDESTDLSPAVPVVIDGRYFSESIRNALSSLKAEEDRHSDNSPATSAAPRPATGKMPAKGPAPTLNKSASEKEPKTFQENTATVLSPPALTPQSGKTKREKIEEILKKGL